MTSFAFIRGVVPLVVSTGAGAEMRHAMGVAVFSGMLGVTFFGLFLTPVFYVLLREVEKRVARGSVAGGSQSNRVIRRSGPVVHRDLSRQRGHAVVQ
jgi:multidrug efflux pump